MTDAQDGQGGATQGRRISDTEMEVTRLFAAPPRLVFRAWTTPDLFRQWWVPKSMGMTLRDCDMDVRTGGGYRLVFGSGPAEGMEFFGKYLEVTPHVRLVWTNDEGVGATTIVTFEDMGDRTRLTLREVYPTKEALDADLDAGAVGMQDGMPEQFGQLDDLLATLG